MTVFPDPEAVVVAFLNARLANAGLTARASTRVPNPRPQAFITANRTGGALRSVSHEDAMVTVECWATSSVEASTLARRVASWLVELDQDGCHVPQGSAGWVGRPAYLEDPVAQVPRYVMTVIVRCRIQEA